MIRLISFLKTQNLDFLHKSRIHTYLYFVHSPLHWVGGGHWVGHRVGGGLWEGKGVALGKAHQRDEPQSHLKRVLG